MPSDADATITTEEDEGAAAPTREELDALRGDYVEVFICETTFERELTMLGTLSMLEAGTRDIGAPRIANSLSQLMAQIAFGQAPVDLTEAKNQDIENSEAVRQSSLRTDDFQAHSIGDRTSTTYIQNAVNWLVGNAPNG